jgi:sigma-B regulation protein RsbU (phosphoserine phosphatase)
MKGRRGIAFRIAALVLASVTVIFLFIFGYNYFYARRIVIREVEESARNLAAATVNRIDVVLGKVEKVPLNLAAFLEASPPGDERSLLKVLRAVVEGNGDIYGAAVAFEPGVFGRNPSGYAPYFYKSRDTVRYVDLAGDSYRYVSSDWYQIPRELEHPVWTEPYFDEGAGNIVMSTFSVPFYKTVKGKRTFAGIVTADVSLRWLQEIVASIRIEETGYGFLISKNGTFVTHPLPRLVMNETIFTIAEARNDGTLRRIGRDMIHGKSGFVPFRSLLTGKNCWMVFAPLSSSGWSLGVLFPQDELMKDVAALNRSVLILGVIGALLLVAVIVFIAGSITRPLRMLAGATAEISGGNLDNPLPPVASRDEVGDLARSFESMRLSLKKYIADLTETTAAKERIESELKIAHDIQMGILHKVFPPYPDRSEIDIYAVLDPAKEVGGDLFDFFFLDDDHLCFHVGDVSGKGVPASLFMDIPRTIIKTKATKGLDAHKILERVNEDISVDNTSFLFVTLFLGILDVRTGRLQYSNGGHSRPYILRASGSLEMLAGTDGIALGAVEDLSYASRTAVLERGDVLFLYTDGVTEAMNPGKALFTEARLEKELVILKGRPLKEIVLAVQESVRAFAEGEPQADDITVLTIQYYGSPVFDAGKEPPGGEARPVTESGSTAS